MSLINLIDEKTYTLIYKLFNEKATIIMTILSHFGSATVLISFTVASFMLMKKRKYPILISLNLITVFLENRILKLIIRRQRPQIFSLVLEKGYSFPSGHAMVAMGFYGFLIYITYKKVNNKKVRNSIIAFLSILILSIGISRIYLGVHYTTDVLGGYLFGILHLIIYIKYGIKLLEKKLKFKN